MAENCWKLLDMAQHAYKWLETAECLKWLSMAVNGFKWLQTAGIS